MASILDSLPARRRSRTYDVTDLGVLITYLKDYLVPVGSVISKLSDTVPSDAWLKIEGQTLSKTDYDELYAELGGAFGETTTTFNLPNMDSAYLTGAASAAEIGTVIGGNTKTLTVAQLPSHSHTVTDAGHTHTFTGTPHTHTFTGTPHTHGVTDAGHDHTDETNGSQGATSGSDFDAAVYDAAGNTSTDTTGITIDNETAGGTNSLETAGGTNASATTGVSVDNTGSGDAVDVRPRSIPVFYFIKART